MNAENQIDGPGSARGGAGKLSPGAERLIALLGGVVAVGLGVAVGLFTLLAAVLYDWQTCSTGYDLWNALLGVVGACTALALGAAGLACIGHAVTLGMRRVIAPAIKVASIMLVLSFGVAILNPTPDTGEPDYVGKDDCYNDLS
jgi:hypothetical protein